VVSHKKKRRTVPGRPMNRAVALAPRGYAGNSILGILAGKRRGGSDNFKGIVYQVRYSAWKLLSHLNPSAGVEDRWVTLEGIEDVDAARVSGGNDMCVEFVQVKNLGGRIDAANFWNQGVLQNFAETYLLEPASRFRLVHTTRLADGYLTRLAEANKAKGQLRESDLRYWTSRLDSFRAQKTDWDWSAFRPRDFLRTVRFELVSEDFLVAEGARLLVADYGVLNGNERQYLEVINWYTVECSRDRRTIRAKDLLERIECVTDEIARGPHNLAIKERWLERVLFDRAAGEEDEWYFKGIAAKPSHVAAGLPASRGKWAQEIRKVFEESDITVIRASSGQGKSTLAWQAASDLSKQGWSVYELHRCKGEDGTGDLLTFIESRLRIGEVPLIVIDGLRDAVSGWAELAGRVQALPAKFIVTAREEDWYRFGGDTSRLRIIPISISMTRDEAQNIFHQFSRASQIHPSIKSWQAAWEKVEDQGLLIEYVFLLTQGQMIEERLVHQVRTLAGELDSAAKLEILRLVSVADLCGVKLRTSTLVDSVASRVGFAGDRGAVLESLKREYYIQADNREYVEGLHPVRSRHLAAALQETLPLIDTIMALVPLIPNQNLAQFCSQAVQLTEGAAKDQLLQGLARFASARPYVEVNSVLNGIFSIEALNHWRVNGAVYDKLPRQAITFFAMEAFPWSGFRLLEGAKPAEGAYRNFLENFSKTVGELVPLNPGECDTLKFVRELSHQLESRPLLALAGLGRLAEWFYRFGVECPPLMMLDEERLWGSLKSLQIDDAGELLTVCYKERPNLYRSVLTKHRGEVLGWLKRETDTLTIVERDNALEIEYALDSEADSPNASEQSVRRLAAIRSFLPQYGTYSARGLWPPIPWLERYRSICDDSVKQISAENLPSEVQVELNRLWIDQLSAHYDSPSMYDWQEQWRSIRVQSLDLAKVTVRLFESLLQADQARIASSATKLENTLLGTQNQLLFRKGFPAGEHSLLRRSDTFKTHVDMLDDWAVSWGNFLNQIEPALTRSDQAHIANVNAQMARHKLVDMQAAYDTIADGSFPYFDVSSLKDDESRWYDRLSKTVAFYVSTPNQAGQIRVPRDRVATWWAEKEGERVSRITEAVRRYEEESGIHCVSPTRTTTSDGIVRKTAIGFRRVNPEQMDTVFLGLALRLAELDPDVHQIVLVPLEGNHPASPHGLSLTRDFVQRLRHSKVNGTMLDAAPHPIPLLIPLEEGVLETLPGISPAEHETPGEEAPAAVMDGLVSLWRLSEALTRLSSTEPVERSWLCELQQRYLDKLEGSIGLIKSQGMGALAAELSRFADGIVEHQELLTTDDWAELFGRCTESLGLA
jgi:hypothetical protein